MPSKGFPLPASAIDRIKRYDKLTERDHNWRGTWQELADYFVPRKARIFTMGSASGGISVNRQPEGTGGLKLTSKMFDSSPVMAANNLCSSLQGTLTSDAFKWFALKSRDQSLNDNLNVARWLDECTDRIYLAIQQSNFTAEIAEVYLDMVVFGTGQVLVVEKNPAHPTFSGLRFQANAIGAYTIAEDSEGYVDTVFSDLYMSALAAHEQWGDAIGEKMMTKLEKHPDKMVRIIHQVAPRKHYERRTMGLAAKAKPYESVYFDYEGKHIISEGGFDEMPYMVPRWTKGSAEVWGRGPGWIALPDAKTLNKSVEMTLNAWAKAINTPLMARHNGVIGTVRLHPGGVTVVRDMESLKPLPDGSKYDVNQIQSEHIRNAIRDCFFNQQLQLPNGPQMTATEVERRMELMQRFLGPTVGRVQSELLARIIKRGFSIMHRRGAFPPMPAELQKTGSLDIEYQGPLARAQRASDVQALERAIQALLPLAEHDPAVMDIIDTDNAARMILNRNEVPPDIIRTEASLKQKRDMRAQDKQMQQLQTMGKGGAPLLKAIAPGGVIPKEKGQ